MNRYILTSAIVFANFSFVIAQSRGGADKPSPVSQPAGTVIKNVPPVEKKAPFKYDYVDAFNNGLAKVIIDKKVGFIDRTGKEVIPVKYDDASMTDSKFTDGLIKLKLGNKYGMVDNNNNVIIPFEYNLMDNLSEGMINVYAENKGTGFIDKTGKIVAPLKYEITSILYGIQFKDGLGMVQLNHKMGFVDKTGKEVIQLKYDKVHNFSEGFAVVATGTYPQYKYGYINTKGEEVIPLIYDNAGDFKGGMAVVCTGAKSYSYGEATGGKWGLINKAGKVIVAPAYDNYESYEHGFASFEGMIRLFSGNYPNETTAYFDKQGKELKIPKAEFSEGVAVIYKAALQKCGIIDKTGKELSSFIYDYSNPPGKCVDGLIPISLNGKFGFIDKSGKTIIPHQYDYASAFKNGYATVANNKLSGIIDKTGKLIIPIQYQWVGLYSDGWFIVKQNDKYNFINSEGKFITD